MTTRRNLLIALGAGALAALVPWPAKAQTRLRRIGSLWEGEQSDSNFVPQFEAFKEGMRELGYTEGKDYVIEHRFTQNDHARLPALAAEPLALKVDLIVSGGTPSAVAARNATREIPILIITAGDPVGSGLAASLRRPGGNVTGLTGSSVELSTKRLDLLRQISQGMRRVGFVYNPDNATDALGLRQFESDCEKLGFKSVRGPVRKAEEIAAAFNALQRDKAQGAIVTSSSTNISWRGSIIDYAAKQRLPVMYGNTIFAEAGGLISYAAGRADLYRRAAAYADKIFKGAKPGDLPIEQPLKFETVINLKTAKAIGTKIPDVVMLRADKVIE